MRSRLALLIVLLVGAALVPGSAGPASAANIFPSGTGRGIDIASYQHPGGAAIDWNAVKGAGSDYAFIKATEGVSYTNPYFAQDWVASYGAGLARGAYHYAQPTANPQTAVDQANAFIAAAGTSREPGAMPPMLDLETANGLTPAQLVTWTQRFLDTVQQLTGRKALIYTYPYFWKNQMGNSSAFTSYPLFIADYRDLSGNSQPALPLPGGWQQWTFWQYSSSGQIPGINSPAVDLDRAANPNLSGLTYDGWTPPPAPVTPSTPPDLSPYSGLVLQIGSKGAAVAALQQALQIAPVDGDFGPQTQAAVMAFQTAQGLPSNGIVGPETWTALGAPAPSPSPSPTTSPSPSPSPTPSGVPVAAGGTVSSVPGQSVPTTAKPLLVSVTSKAAGRVVFAAVTAPKVPSGMRALAAGSRVTAPAGALTLSFALAPASLPAGSLPSDVHVLLNGALVPGCTAGATGPCVVSTARTASALSYKVTSPSGGDWTFAVDRLGRIAGADRIGTAAAVSQATTVAGAAKAAVLARSDGYADALAGAPLAAAKGGPLLLTGSTALAPTAGQELTRALPRGGTVYLLGGTAAVGADVARQVEALGFRTARLAGNDRYATAAAIATAINPTGPLLLTTGTGFADALAAGAAAAQVKGAVLLTAGDRPAAATATFLAAHPGLSIYAVGGPALRAHPKAQPVVGADRYATGVAVARTFFPSATGIGLASGASFPDALAAGPAMGATGQPLLLTGSSTLSPAVAAYLGSVSTAGAHLFGGTAALSKGVSDSVLAKLR
ncbi:MAG: putative secreted glycoside hydrolase family 25 [Frankiales bacterium]|nr:putative secreted glycoside hydrolase family 25 [Frankiales bacterium]